MSRRKCCSNFSFPTYSTVFLFCRDRTYRSCRHATEVSLELGLYIPQFLVWTPISREGSTLLIKIKDDGSAARFCEAGKFVRVYVPYGKVLIFDANTAHAGDCYPLVENIRAHWYVSLAGEGMIGDNTTTCSTLPAETS